MDITVKISGTTYRATDKYSIKEQIGQTASSTIYVKIDAQAVPISQQLVEVYAPGDVLFYSGIIQTVTPPKWSSGEEVYICALTCKSLDVIFDQRVASYDAEDVYIHDIVDYIYTNYLVEENVAEGDISTILDDPYEEYSVSNSTLRSILNDLADDASAVCYIDCNWNFYFVTNDTFIEVTPPEHLTSLKIKETGSKLVTVQHVSGSTDETTSHSENTVWSDSQTEFDLTYSISEMTGVTINGVTVQAGTDDTDPDNTFIFEYGGSVLTLNASATTQPSTGDNVVAVYDGYSEVYATAENTTLKNTIAALNGTSGKIEAVEIDSSVTTETDGETLAQTLLDNNETREETVTCFYHSDSLDLSTLSRLWTLAYSELGISGEYVIVERTITDYSADEYKISVKLKNKNFYSRYGTILGVNTKEVSNLAAKSTKTITTYTWIKYSAYEDGTDLTDEFIEGSTQYIGTAYNKATPTESTDPLDYSWQKYVGDAGYGAYLTIPTYTFQASSTGYIDEISITTEVKVLKGGDVVDIVVSRLTAPDGMTIEQTGTQIKITASGSLLDDSGALTIPVSLFVPISGYVFGRDPSVYGRSPSVYGRTVNSPDATSFELSFTWGKAYTGAQGETGEQGEQAYTYRGRFYDDFPGSIVSNDFWLVYWEDSYSGSETYSRGIWTYDGTDYSLIADDSGVNSPYIAQCLGDILWAVNNGYGSVSDYGDIDYIDNLVANNAFITNLGLQTLILASGGVIKSDGFAAGSTGFNLDGDSGSAEFNDITVRGDVEADTFLIENKRMTFHEFSDDYASGETTLETFIYTADELRCMFQGGFADDDVNPGAFGIGNGFNSGIGESTISDPYRFTVASNSSGYIYADVDYTNKTVSVVLANNTGVAYPFHIQYFRYITI